MQKPNVILMVGEIGVGKSYIGKKIAEMKNYTYIDKDTVTTPLTEYILAHNSPTQNSHDRESDFYIQTVRPLEYQALLNIAYDNVKLGHSVVLTAGFEQEILQQDYLHTHPQMKALREVATIIVVRVTVDSTTLLNRLIKRNEQRDRWKLNNWETYMAQVSGLTVRWHPDDYTQLGFDNSDMLPVLYDLKLQGLVQSIR
ncbi:ATPase [Lysinibacillus alkalisoli]|uniref:ATPase n=1 Tax=Lysinibacillus alkalisoli TaxID=1911548 RepID=A0A917LD11_9BACI|nr:AAA family ATPase [Lysinibacillus alkalisoli]GGG13932.1 ATPase [Lysinibacillus alkalisoli]